MALVLIQALLPVQFLIQHRVLIHGLLQLVLLKFQPLLLAQVVMVAMAVAVLVRGALVVVEVL
jgi:hypothetical protein